MSPKPVDVRRALNTLRQERPSPEATERARLVLARPASRRSLARPLTAAMIATALAVVVLMPRTHAGAVWAQTLVNTYDVAPSHSVSRGKDGVVDMEEWRSGRKRAHVLYYRGKPVMESHDDGRRLYNFAGTFGNPQNPNGRRWGMVSNSPGPVFSYESPQGSSEALLKQPGVEVVAHEEAGGGKPETYRLKVPRPWMRVGKKEEIVAEVEPRDHRIVRLSYPRYGGSEAIDYPASIPASVFEPRPHAIAGVDVYDLPAQTRTIERTLRRGLGKEGPVTLRLVTLDGYGRLWAFWTGPLPDARMSRPVRIPGVRSHDYATKKALTSDWRPTPYARLAPNVTGERIGGMSFVPRSKLGSTVDLDVPYVGGVARFRRIPVLRVGLFIPCEELLGVYAIYPKPKKKSRSRHFVPAVGLP